MPVPSTKLPADVTRVGGECDVAVDGDDRALVAFRELGENNAPPRTLSVYRHEGSGWTVLGGAPILDGSSPGSSRGHLAVAGDGTIYVAYDQEGGKVQRFPGGAWSALPPPKLGRVRRLIVDSAGLPVLLGDDADTIPALVRFDGAAWSAPMRPVVDFDGGGFLEEGVLTAAPRPDGSIAVLARTSSASLQAFTLSGTTWSPLGAPLAAGGEYPELSSSPGGGLAAARSAGGNVFAARFDPGTQAFVELGDGLGQSGARYAVVALDSFDRPFVAWREQAGAVKVSVFAGGTWGALPDPAARGTLPAIALDRRGLPVVCWEGSREAGPRAAIQVARAVAR